MSAPRETRRINSARPAISRDLTFYYGLSSVEQDDSGDQLNCGEKSSGEFVVACGDAPEVFEVIDEALDEVTLAVEHEIVFALCLTVGLIPNL